MSSKSATTVTTTQSDPRSARPDAPPRTSGDRVCEWLDRRLEALLPYATVIGLVVILVGAEFAVFYLLYGLASLA